MFLLKLLWRENFLKIVYLKNKLIIFRIIGIEYLKIDYFVRRRRFIHLSKTLLIIMDIKIIKDGIFIVILLYFQYFRILIKPKRKYSCLNMIQESLLIGKVIKIYPIILKYHKYFIIWWIIMIITTLFASFPIQKRVKVTFYCRIINIYKSIVK